MEKVRREQSILKGVKPKLREREEKPPLKGVHPKLREIKMEAPPISGVGRFPGFKYHGGPVITNPQVHNIFLGDWSSAANQSRATRLSQFMTDLLNSEYMNILSQYGCGSSGKLVKSLFIENSNQDLMDSDIHSILQNAIDNDTIPEPNSSNVYIIYLDDNTGITDPDGGNLCETTNDQAFGFHFSFTTASGNPCYYAIVPGLNDDCMENTCGGDDTKCSLHLAQTQEQRQTQVTSHEFSEMISDPNLDAWFDPDTNTGENGDICNGHPGTITVGSNTWTVQLMYSKVDDINSNGATTCIVGSPEPLTSLIS